MALLALRTPPGASSFPLRHLDGDSRRHFPLSLGIGGWTICEITLLGKDAALVELDKLSGSKFSFVAHLLGSLPIQNPVAGTAANPTTGSLPAEDEAIAGRSPSSPVEPERAGASTP